MLSLPDLAKVESDVVYPEPESAPIVGLPVFYNGIRCLGTTGKGRRCRYVCRTIDGIQKHCKKEHQWVNQQKRGGHVRQKQAHSANKLWKDGRACQRFFKVGEWQRYFEVSATASPVNNETTTEQKGQFFQRQYGEVQGAEQSIADAANRVEGFDGHRSAVIPWLQTTGIADHLHGLKKDEIRAAIALPTDDADAVLPRLLQSMEAMLQEAHSWCFDGPECMLTWPCRVVLSRFQPAQVEAQGSTRAFDPQSSRAPSNRTSGWRSSSWRTFAVSQLVESIISVPMQGVIGLGRKIQSTSPPSSSRVGGRSYDSHGSERRSQIP